MKDQIIGMDGYDFYGGNRVQVLKSRCGSGGIGIFVKHALQNMYQVESCFELQEFVLGLKLTDKVSKETLLIYNVYLPPESSHYGRNNERVLDLLTIEIYGQAEADLVAVCGDFNARIGEKDDCLQCDTIRRRVPVDRTCNKQGDRLLTFLNDTKCCLVNSRITPEHDNFTSIAGHKGVAVVDYNIVQQTDLEMIKEMKVKTMSELMDQLKLMDMVSEDCRLPDHSLLSMTVELGTTCRFDSGNTLGSKEVKCSKLICKVGDSYMNSDLAIHMIPVLLEQLEENDRNQQGIDLCYEELTNFILNEAENSLEPKRRKRPCRKYKEYWDEELSDLWRKMRNCEHEYMKVKKKNKKGHKNSLTNERRNFKEAQRLFDRTLRNKKRNHCKGKLMIINKCNVNNPTEFWNHIKRLGPKVKQDIPWEVVENGEILTEIPSVLKKWHKVFSELYQVNSEGFNNSFKQEKLAEDVLSHYTSSKELNCHIKYSEVEKAVRSLKTKKAAGLDMVPNELLKCDAVKQLLHSLFVLCFAEGILPSLWQKVIIHPIPKLPGRQTDPLQYRGLALQCCIFKVLSAIVNDRIVKHLNERDILPDEQNGFRKKRSCQQHIHSLMTLVRNHCTSKNSAYCAFIDFRKAFDFIDRKLLSHKLKELRIDGKIHNLIDQFYSDTGNLLRINGHFTEEVINSNGVLHGNNLSPTLFSCYIDGLIQELKNCDEGIMIVNGRSVCVLAYADDIVLISKTPTGLQKLLDVTDNWCRN